MKSYIYKMDENKTPGIPLPAYYEKDGEVASLEEKDGNVVANVPVGKSITDFMYYGVRITPEEFKALTKKSPKKKVTP